MLKGFGNVLVKELKELARDPKILLGMIVVPLLMFPALGGIMSFAVQSAQEQAQKATLLVANNDGGNYSRIFIANLSQYVRTFVVNDTTPQEVISQNLLAEYNSTQFIEIPSGFSINLTKYLNADPNITAEVNTYSIFSGSGVFEGVGSSSIINFFVEAFNRQFAPNLVYQTPSSIIKGQIAYGVDPQQLSTLMISQAIAMPITIMILLTYSMQIAATSVAMEKEEKTLETLLTMPVDRFAILMGKLSGSIVIAGVGALTYMIGFNFYMGGFASLGTAGASIDLAKYGLVPTVLGYTLLGVSLFVTLLSALALAVVLSAFAEDVRSAQSLVGYVYPLLFVPSFLLIYIDVNTLPIWLRAIIYAIPFSHPVIASRAVTVGDYVTAGLGIVYVAAFTIGIMYVASRLFATEKILTAKFKFKGLRRSAKTTGEDLQ